jgi:hypothetical protein
LNGAWHYREAERLLMVATTKVDAGSAEQVSVLTQARIHAALAGTAATIELAGAPYPEWSQIINATMLGGHPA